MLMAAGGGCFFEIRGGESGGCVRGLGLRLGLGVIWGLGVDLGWISQDRPADGHCYYSFHALFFTRIGCIADTFIKIISSVRIFISMTRVGIKNVADFKMI
jgi:hypothetical protein